MENNKDGVFNLILASTVHDMKNSLGMLGESFNLIMDQSENAVDDKTKKFYGIVQYESSRINNSLMQLLALYKLENSQLPFNPNYINIYDFLDEQRLIHSPLLEAKKIECTIEVDESLEGIFDENLISTVLENVLGNAIRYTKSKIKLSCTQTKTTNIIISDNGPGYPESMLSMMGDYMLGINQSTGSTGLGLYFANEIAKIHINKDKFGTIKLLNGGELGGGQFEIKIP